MPTPFMHLNAAMRVLPTLEKAGVAPASLPAYLLGHIAPDVTSITGKPRVSTHFISPRDPELRRLVPHAVMLERCPELWKPFSSEQQSFVMGVLGHLKADELWMHRIAVRFFRGIAPEHRHQRRLAHDAFRTRVDIEALECLEAKVTELLEQGESKGWYPLENDEALHEWRDRLLKQMKSGQSLALQVFAKRLKVTEDEFETMVFGEEWQEKHVGPLCRREELAAYWKETDPAMARVMVEYGEKSAVHHG